MIYHTVTHLQCFSAAGEAPIRWCPCGSASRVLCHVLQWCPGIYEMNGARRKATHGAIETSWRDETALLQRSQQQIPFA